MQRIVVLAFDGFPVTCVRPRLTPNLLALAGQGGMAAAGGRAGLPSSTYPNFLSFAAGRPIAQLARTWFDEVTVSSLALAAWFSDGKEWHLDKRVLLPLLVERSREIETLFDLCTRFGISTATAVGDPWLCGLLHLGRTGRCWPLGGDVPCGVAVNGHRYIEDAVTLPHVIEAVVSGARLVFGQFNDCDTAGHDHGPDSPEARRAYSFADEAVGGVCEALGPWWDESLVVVISDHGMQSRGKAPPIKIDDDWLALIIPDGGAAWVLYKRDLPRGTARARLLAKPGVADVLIMGDLLLAVAEPGRIFAAQHLPTHGFHGGSDAQATVAIVGGGSPQAAVIGARIAAEPWPHASWAPLILRLLGVSQDPRRPRKWSPIATAT